MTRLVKRVAVETAKKKRPGGAAGVNAAREDFITALEEVLALTRNVAVDMYKANTVVANASQHAGEALAKAVRDAAWAICGTLLLVGAAITIAIASQ